MNNLCSIIKRYNISSAINIICVNKINIYKNVISTRQYHNVQPKVNQIFKFWCETFSKMGISEPEQSIKYILAHVYHLHKVSDLYKIFSSDVDLKTEQRIEDLCKKRLLKMPIQYILGEWHFREFILKMEPPVFIPRPETEMLVDLILDDLKDVEKKINILEICCGSGAISLALLKCNSYIEITAVDKNEAACILTLKNISLHKLNHRITVRNYCVNDENRLQDVNDKFDMIISNPPYVPTQDVYAVQPEIRLYEDLDALDGGADGLNIIKSILFLSKDKLVSGGKLFLETDPSHPTKISHILQSQPDLRLKFINSYKDFCNKERFVKIEKI